MILSLRLHVSFFFLFIMNDEDCVWMGSEGKVAYHAGDAEVSVWHPDIHCPPLSARCISPPPVRIFTSTRDTKGCKQLSGSCSCVCVGILSLVSSCLLNSAGLAVMRWLPIGFVGKTFTFAFQMSPLFSETDYFIAAQTTSK